MKDSGVGVSGGHARERGRPGGWGVVQVGPERERKGGGGTYTHVKCHVIIIAKMYFTAIPWTGKNHPVFFPGRGEGSLPVIFVTIELSSIECDTNKSKMWSHIVVYANLRMLRMKCEHAISCPPWKWPQTTQRLEKQAAIFHRSHREKSRKGPVCRVYENLICVFKRGDIPNHYKVNLASTRDAGYLPGGGGNSPSSFHLLPPPFPTVLQSPQTVQYDSLSGFWIPVRQQNHFFSHKKPEPEFPFPFSKGKPRALGGGPCTGRAGTPWGSRGTSGARRPSPAPSRPTGDPTIAVRWEECSGG